MLSKQFNRFALGVVLVLLVGLMTPALSLAAGSSPDAPLAVSAQMRHLDVGGQDWYAFTTAGADSNNNPSHVLITLNAVPDGSATFKVWSAEGLHEFATQDPGHPVYAMGEGTKLEYRDGAQTLDRYGGDLVWPNGFNVGGTFYVQVGQTGPTPSNYLLTITGDNISFPANAAATPTTAGASRVCSRHQQRYSRCDGTGQRNGHRDDTYWTDEDTQSGRTAVVRGHAWSPCSG